MSCMMIDPFPDIKCGGEENFIYHAFAASFNE